MDGVFLWVALHDLPHILQNTCSMALYGRTTKLPKAEAACCLFAVCCLLALLGVGVEVLL